VTGLVFSGAGLLPFLAAPLPVGIVILVIAAVVVRGLMPLLPAFDRAEWGKILRLTLAFAAASAVGTVYVYTAIVATSVVGTARDNGYLGASFRIFTILATLSLLLVSSAFPVLARAARDDHARLQYAVQRMTEIALIVGGLMTLGTVLGAPLAIHVLAGSEFEPAVDVLRIHGAVLAVNSLALTWGFALVSMRRHRELLAANSCALILSVLLTVLLVPVLGAQGAALATLAGDSLLAVYYGIVLFVRGDLDLELRVVPWVLLAAASGGVVWFVPGLPVIATVLIAAAVYLVVLFVGRVVPVEVIRAFRRGRAQ
jgi:O-antigen/teichoic acid export membrane protein